MVNNRRPTQEAHERATVDTFLRGLNRRYRSAYKVIDEPNPPEAIVKTGRITRWVEVTTAFWSPSYAQDLYSYATPGEAHKPLVHDANRPDERFAKNFVAAVAQKLQKASYEVFRDKYGPGYLVVSVQYPLFGVGTWQFIKEAWSPIAAKDRGCFRSIYLVRPGFQGHKVELWRPPQ